MAASGTPSVARSAPTATLVKWLELIDWRWCYAPLAVPLVVCCMGGAGDEGGAIGRLMTLYWKVASLLAITAALCVLVDARPLATRSRLAQLLMVASVCFWWISNEEARRPAALAPPARLDGAHTGAGRLSVLRPAGGGPEAPPPSVACGGNWIVPSPCQVCWRPNPEAPSPGRQGLVRLRLRQIFTMDPHRRS